MNALIVVFTLSVIGGIPEDPTSGAAPSAHPVQEYTIEEGTVPPTVVTHAHGVGHRPTATRHGWIVDWFGPMPQTCYQPRFGCYPGNPRTIHRYPAFHGYYYRNPYNYRHLFEYPWHAQPNEPQPFLSSEASVGNGDPVGAPSGLVPQPDPALP